MEGAFGFLGTLLAGVSGASPTSLAEVVGLRFLVTGPSGVSSMFVGITVLFSATGLSGTVAVTLRFLLPGWG